MVAARRKSLGVAERGAALAGWVAACLRRRRVGVATTFVVCLGDGLAADFRLDLAALRVGLGWCLVVVVCLAACLWTLVRASAGRESRRDAARHRATRRGVILRDRAACA